MNPREIAENFINRYAAKKVGGGEMLRYLTGMVEKFGQNQYNTGYKEGRAAYEKVWHRGREVGFEEGMAEGLKIKKEAPIWPQYKVKCMYDLYNISKKIRISSIISDFGISHTTFYNRLNRGLSYKEALMRRED